MLRPREKVDRALKCRKLHQILAVEGHVVNLARRFGSRPAAFFEPRADPLYWQQVSKDLQFDRASDLSDLFPSIGRTIMTAHTTHESHSHQHGANCGHTAIEHEGHVDYLSDGHLHHP